MRIKERYKGISSHRYKREPLEKIFAEMWQEENNKPCQGGELLSWILDRRVDFDGCPPLRATQDQHTVAATVIQWLGSTVGQHFLVSVIAKAIKQDIFFPYEDLIRAFKESDSYNRRKGNDKKNT